MLPDDICFVDIETTGTSAISGKIVEIGIVKVKNMKVVQEYNQLINPQTRLDPYIELLTGITQKDLENAPTFYDIQKDILEILANSIFVAHNVRFDYAFVRNEFERLGINFSSKHFCTVKLARLLYPNLRKCNLDTLIEKFNLECKNRHRAFDDAHAIWQFYEKSFKQLDKKYFESAVSKALKRPSVPLNIDLQTLEKLPEGTGVYIFYNKEGLPLYIGKSVNLKNRILSHFSNDRLSATDMKISQTIYSIETISTDGELGALLLESTLIKKHMPLYNRLLRQSRKMITLIKTINEDGYLTIEEKYIEEITIEDLDSIVGVFKSKKQMKDFLYQISRDHSLCPKLLKLEKSNKSCFYFQLGICNGACIKKENTLRYNLKFDNAFFKVKIKPWNFDGPILIKEKNKAKEAFVIDKWCLVGNIKNENDLNNISKDYIFDYDTYKILSKYILNPNKSFSITKLTI